MKEAGEGKARPRRPAGKPGALGASLETDFQPSPLFVGSLEKGLRVLRAFDLARRPLKLLEIAAATGLDKSAAQRFTATLERLGYLKKDDFKRYLPTPRVLQLGFAYLQSETAIDLAVPHLQQAHEDCEESINYTQLDDCDVVWLLRLPGPHAVSVVMSVGARLPAYCTAPGRAILAHLPPDQALDILNRSERTARTPHTVTDIPGLLAKLEEVRRDDFALAVEETFLGDISTAAPVFDARNQVVGAVNIAVPTSRWSAAEVLERFSPLAARTAAAISAAHGAGLSERQAR